MKSGENIDTQRINRALAVLKQAIGEAEGALKDAGAPNLGTIKNLEEISSKEKREYIEDKLWFIFAYGKYYVKKAMSNISVPRIFLEGKQEKEQFHLYENSYKPLISETIRGLIGASRWVPASEEIEIWIVDLEKGSHKNYDPCLDINHCMDTYEKRALSGRLRNYIKDSVDFFNDFSKIGSEKFVIRAHDEEKSNIKFAFELAMEFSAILRQCIIDGVSVVSSVEKFYPTEEGALPNNDALIRHQLPKYIESFVSEGIGFMQKPYFKPNDWVANEKSVSPVVITRPEKNVPEPVRARIDEIYHSFIFGNWMAVMALSRCVLEYATKEVLLDRGIGICYDKGEKKEQEKPLRELAKIAVDSSELHKSVDIVVNHGNYVMHPRPTETPNCTNSLKGLGNMIPPSEGSAKRSFKAISKIIGTLYSA